jgi:hypothetical protein
VPYHSANFSQSKRTPCARARLLLADRSAVLPLHAGRPVPCFDPAGLVDQTDRLSLAMIPHDDFRHAGPHPACVPGHLREEFLQRADRPLRRQRDRLDALAGRSDNRPPTYTGRCARLSRRAKQSLN